MFGPWNQYTNQLPCNEHPCLQLPVRFSSFYEFLTNIVVITNAVHGQVSRHIIIQAFTTLAALIKHAPTDSDTFQTQHPATPLLATVWPLAQSLLAQHYNDAEFLEVSCDYVSLH